MRDLPERVVREMAFESSPQSVAPARCPTCGRERGICAHVAIRTGFSTQCLLPMGHGGTGKNHGGMGASWNDAAGEDCPDPFHLEPSTESSPTPNELPTSDDLGVESPALDDVEVVRSVLEAFVVAGDNVRVPTARSGFAALDRLTERLQRAEQRIEKMTHGEHPTVHVPAEVFQRLGAKLQAAEGALREIAASDRNGVAGMSHERTPARIARKYFENHSTEESEG